MKFFSIHHPAISGPVSFVRWAKWHISQWLGSWARSWEEDALYPGRRRDNEIPF